MEQTKSRNINAKRVKEVNEREIRERKGQWSRRGQRKQEINCDEYEKWSEKGGRKKRAKGNEKGRIMEQKGKECVKLST